MDITTKIRNLSEDERAFLTGFIVSEGRFCFALTMADYSETSIHNFVTAPDTFFTKNGLLLDVMATMLQELIKQTIFLPDLTVMKCLLPESFEESHLRYHHTLELVRTSLRNELHIYGQWAEISVEDQQAIQDLADDLFGPMRNDRYKDLSVWHYIWAPRWNKAATLAKDLLRQSQLVATSNKMVMSRRYSDNEILMMLDDEKSINRAVLEFYLRVLFQGDDIRYQMQAAKQLTSITGMVYKLRESVAVLQSGANCGAIVFEMYQAIKEKVRANMGYTKAVEQQFALEERQQQQKEFYDSKRKAKQQMQDFYEPTYTARSEDKNNAEDEEGTD